MKVSVVLPTYNRENLLGRSIQSVLSQSYTDFELIVVDDASIDHTETVVKSFSDGRIRYIKSETNVGGAEARNIGIRAARADLICFQDSDDEWRCQKLQRCVDTINKCPELDGVFSGYWLIDGTRSSYAPKRRPPASTTELYQALLRQNCVGTPTAMVKRSALVRVGYFDAGLPRFQDWDLFLRVSKIARIAYIDEALVLAFRTPQSITTDGVAHVIALEKLYEKHRSAIRNDRRLHATWLGRLGEAYILTGRGVKGRGALLRSIAHNPRNIRNIARLLICTICGRSTYSGLKSYFGGK